MGELNCFWTSLKTPTVIMSVNALGGLGTSKNHCTSRHDYTSKAERKPKSQTFHSLLLGLECPNDV